MKLASDMVIRTLDQFEAEVLPDSHPAMPKLNEAFGEHTFFVDDEGLHIVEPAADTAAGDRLGNVVTVGRWNDARTSMTLQEPEPSDIVIDLGADRTHPAS